MRDGRRLIFVNLMRGVALCFVLGVAGAATAQQTFPNRPIRLVLPFPSGSAADTVYRPIAEHMTQTLGQPVLLEGRPGGGGMVASLFVKAAPPDGYTLYLASNSVTTKSFGDNPQINILRDYTMIAPGSIGSLILVVNAEQVKATTLKELIEEARANPGRLNYASFGVGSSGHMLFELIGNEAKVRWVHVPFQGSAQALTDTAEGRTQLSASIYSALQPYLASAGGSGKLRALVVSTAERSSLTPDVPGMKDAGFPQLDYPVWGGYVGPAGMPRDIVNRVNQATNAATKDPKTVELYRKLRVNGVGGTPEELQRIVEREYNFYARLIKETGLKIE